MKWFVVPPLILCGLNTVVAAIVLAASVFYSVTDIKVNGPTEQREECMKLIHTLIPFTGLLMAVSAISLFATMSKRQIGFASTTLVMLVICFALSIYFSVTLKAISTMDGEQAKVLIEKTKKQIEEHDSRRDKWLPQWLDNIQKLSTQCCGIDTFRDYEKLWKDAVNMVPPSCCRSFRNRPGPCPENIARIPFPDTPDNYVKVDVGCINEINERNDKIIDQLSNTATLLTVILLFQIATYCLFYLLQYLDLLKGALKPGDKKYPTNVETKVGTSKSLIISSNRRLIASVDSFEALSLDSITKPPNRLKAMASSLTRCSSSKLNKTNTVFAGLKDADADNGQPEKDASTGSNVMTVGASNIRRREVTLGNSNDGTARNRAGLDLGSGTRLGALPPPLQRTTNIGSMSKLNSGPGMYNDTALNSPGNAAAVFSMSSDYEPNTRVLLPPMMTSSQTEFANDVVVQDQEQRLRNSERKRSKKKYRSER